MPAGRQRQVFRSVHEPVPNSYWLTGESYLQATAQALARLFFCPQRPCCIVSVICHGSLRSQSRLLEQGQWIKHPAGCPERVAMMPHSTVLP